MKESSPSLIQKIFAPLFTFHAVRAGQWIALGGLVGIVSGLGAILFNFLVDQSYGLFLFHGLGWTQLEIAPEATVLQPATGWYYWLLPVVPALGGLIGGLLVFTFAPEAEGHGTDAYIRAFHRLRGRIRSRVPIIKTIASAITIGSGGSAGREGPIAQIGAGFGAWIGNLLKLDAKSRRMLLIAGTAGGVGAIFCAPLGGALFAIEVLYRDQEMETEGLIPAVISSLVAYSVFKAFTGQTQVFFTPEFEFTPWDLIPYTLLGIVCAAIGILYVTVFYGARDHFFNKIPIRPHFKPMIGGGLLGILALAYPQVLSGGYGWIEKVLNENLGITLMISLVFAKLIATSFTISSGGSGGVFGPSLFIGSMLGGAFGNLFYVYFPAWISDPRSFALVGMVAFFSGIAKVPIASLLMVTEMSGSYDLLVPMMLVSSLTYILTDKWTLYEEQVRIKSDSPAHFGEYRTDVLAGLHVREINIQDASMTVPYNMTLGDMLPLILDSSQYVFPVTGAEGQIIGVFSIEDIRTLLLEEHMRNLIVAVDIANQDYWYATPDEDLHSVLRKLTELVTDEIPVLDKETKEFKGLLKRRDILNLYSKRLVEIERSK